ncbi:hypothetical protein N0V84_012114 [Fusarium piperis]|uniref:Cytochrome P450 n=1 Tax=Fusarium piperis TaxID=1435070 RepID=A0A9W8TD67_9HYPO|nr:hypothetical protein N0V84_012114 [Fusarium piperis]
MITSDAIAAWVRADNAGPRTLLVYSSLALTALYIFASPLRHIPGPFLNKFTNAVLALNTLAGRRIHYVHKLHQQYGPVVRISYDQVDVSDLPAFKAIHKIGNGYLKTQWYKDFTRSPVEDVFSTRNPKIHASRRRVLNAPLSPAALRTNWEWLFRDKVQKAVAGIKRGAVHGPADAYHWFTLMSSDVIGQISTGDDFHLVESGKKTGFFEDLESLNRVNTISAVLGPLWPLLVKMGPRRFGEMAAAEQRIHAHCNKVVDEIRERKGSKKTVFTDLINEEASTNDSAVAFEVLGLILAGSGTTAITLAYLVWAVLKRPDIQAKLEDELKELPYLNAVIKESLRLYTAIPGGLQRIVPPSAPLKAGGQTVPPGTTVVTQAYTIHRDPSLWASPETFDPERFLHDNLTHEQKTSLSHYGAGTRICLGMHAANMLMLHTVAALFRECKGLRLAEAMKDEDMEFFNFFVVVPKGDKCLVTLQG